MNIVYVNGKFSTQKISGVQRFSHEIVSEIDLLLAKKEFSDKLNVKLVVPTKKKFKQDQFTNIEVIYLKPFLGLFFWEQIQLPLYTIGFNLINLTGSCPLLKFGQLCTFHDTAIRDVPFAYKFLYRIWYEILFYVQGKISLKVFTVSNFSLNQLVKHYSIKRNKIIIINNSPDHFSRIRRDNSVLKKYNLAYKNFLLVVGNKNPAKNTYKLIKSFSTIHQNKFVLVVVGLGNNSIFTEVKYPAKSNIIYIDLATDGQIKALYIKCKALLFPSLYEGFGIPPMEALYFKKPVIAMPLPSLYEIYNDSIFYFSQNTTKAIKQGILKMMKFQNKPYPNLRPFNFPSWKDGARNILQSLIK